MGRSDFLFPDATFLEGAGSVLDLLGVLAKYNQSPTSLEADVRALRSDWAASADNLWEALTKYSFELDEQRVRIPAGR